jgi:hypothetical protein
VARELLILQNQGIDWIYHVRVLLCCSRATLLSALGGDDDIMVMRNQRGVLVQPTEEPEPAWFSIFYFGSSGKQVNSIT